MRASPVPPTVARSATKEHDVQTERFETVIIGGGQAGLAPATTSAAGPVVRDPRRARAHRRPWRQRWTPAPVHARPYDGLPGMRFPAPPTRSPPGRDGGLPRGLRDALRAAGPNRRARRRLSTDGDGSSSLPATRRFEADNVVVATGVVQTARSSPTSRASSTRRSGSSTPPSTGAPRSFGPGAVLVVGASHSGGDIASRSRGPAPDRAVGRTRPDAVHHRGPRAARLAKPVL